MRSIPTTAAPGAVLLSSQSTNGGTWAMSRWNAKAALAKCRLSSKAVQRGLQERLPSCFIFRNLASSSEDVAETN